MIAAGGLPAASAAHGAARRIARLDLDLVVYLDHTMSSKTTRLAMSRLAPVQVSARSRSVESQ
jgi:hypothetical protein